MTSIFQSFDVDKNQKYKSRISLPLILESAANVAGAHVDTVTGRHDPKIKLVINTVKSVMTFYKLKYL